MDTMVTMVKQINSTGDIQPASSSTINLELAAGQIVRIENAVSTVIYGTDAGGVIRSWFTRHLLYALWTFSSQKRKQTLHGLPILCNVHSEINSFTSI